MIDNNPSRRAVLKGVAAVSVSGVSAFADVGATNTSAVPWMSAVEMARLIRKKKLSAREALAEHLKQIERVNPRVNGIVTLVAEMAQKAAARADEMQAGGKSLGPLHGLPAAHKDLRETRGIRTTFGSPLFRNYVPTENDLIVDRLQRAGAITLGKTNTPEFGAGSQTFNTIFGATRNPWDLTKTCGGSSGGAAVALACGLVPVADGSDTGGSLRNPASFCNIVGFRPTGGRVPDPKAAFAWSTLTTNGCLGRSVEDLAFVLSTIAGPDPRSPLSINEPGALFARPLGRSFKGARVAWFKDLGGVPFDSRVRSVVDASRATFEALGCIVEQAEPDFAAAEISFPVLRAWSSAVAHGGQLREHPAAFKDTLKGEIEEGLRLSGAEVARAERARAQLWRNFQAFLTKYEYFVLPTVQLPPFDIDTPWPTEIAGVKFTNYIDWMKSCWYISATGNPAASVPGGFTPEGLPVGVQIVGRNGEDFSVLQLAHAFEEAAGFSRKRPSIAQLAAIR
jgi:amidase